jgi:hypothetical protein
MMSTEFVKPSPGIARSNKGFTVAVHAEGGVDYFDPISGNVRVATEPFHRPLRYGVYGNSKDLRGVTSSRADEILANVQRAMEYLGYPAEIVRE